MQQEKKLQLQKNNKKTTKKTTKKKKEGKKKKRHRGPNGGNKTTHARGRKHEAVRGDNEQEGNRNRVISGKRRAGMALQAI
jgi:hypothetical protein